VSDLDDVNAEFAALRAEVDRLRAENETLRALLGQQPVEPQPAATTAEPPEPDPATDAVSGQASTPAVTRDSPEAAFSFEQVMRQVRARYVIGLTATPLRRDGHHPIITMQCGPITARTPRRSRSRAPLRTP